MFFKKIKEKKFNFKKFSFNSIFHLLLLLYVNIEKGMKFVAFKILNDIMIISIILSSQQKNNLCFFNQLNNNNRENFKWRKNLTELEKNQVSNLIKIKKYEKIIKDCFT